MTSFARLVDSTPTLMEFDFSHADVERVIAPFVERRLSIEDPEWKDLVAREVSSRQVRRTYWRRKLLGWRESRGAAGERVKSTYSDIWSEFDPNVAFDPKQQHMPHQWNTAGFVMNAAITQRLHVAALARVLRWLRPKSVLEVGSGFGVNLTMLAPLFPDVTFHGIELTQSGVRATQALASKPLPDSFVRFMPEPAIDLDAHRRVTVEQGSSAAMPFADNSFDLVFTRLALEQMENVREKALSEIARIARTHVAMIEPFREMNNCGWSRRYLFGNHYFQGTIADLPRYGLQPVSVFSDWPHKITYTPVLVVAQKMQPIASG